MTETENTREGFHLSEDADWVPDGWEISTLEELTSKIGDGLHGTPQYSSEGDYWFINGNNLVDGKILIKIDTKRCLEDQFDKYKKPLSTRTLLVSINGTLGNVAAYRYEKCILGKSACYLNVNEETSFYFVKYTLLARHFQNEIVRLSNGSTIKNVPLSVIRAYKIKTPPLHEQKAIAAVLSSLDDKIELLREQNETLEALVQTLFKRWFVDFNFPDENGQPYKDNGGKMIPSELGEIPEGWDVGNFNDDGFNVIMGQSPPGDSYNEEGEGLLFFQGRAEFGTRFPTPRLFTTAPKRLAKSGDTLVSVRAPVGDINVAASDCCIGRGLASFQHHFSSYGLYRLKSSWSFFNRFNMEGTVFGSLSKGSLDETILQIAPESLKLALNGILLPLDRKISSNAKHLQTLTTLRDTLLPKLMKGEIRIEEEDFSS